jgi:hypothetical protein
MSTPTVPTKPETPPARAGSGDLAARSGPRGRLP